jgi:hypothetical protein
MQNEATQKKALQGRTAAEPRRICAAAGGTAEGGGTNRGREGRRFGELDSRNDMKNEASTRRAGRLVPSHDPVCR